MPYQLWFKREYVGPILDRSKVVTLRARRVPVEPGQQVVACVGPSRPFAILRILSVDLTRLRDLDADYRAGVEAMYPGVDPVWMLTFELVSQAPQLTDAHESLSAHEHTKIRSTESPDTADTARGSTDHWMTEDGLHDQRSAQRTATHREAR